MINQRRCFDFFACYILCTTSHWFFANLYTSFCTPPSFVGILKTAVLTQSPTCQVLSNLNTYSSSIMNQSVTSALSLFLITASNRYKNAMVA